MEEVRQWRRIGLALGLSLLTYFFASSLEPAAQNVLAITVLAMVLWITEALPLHITALLTSVLLILFGKFPADKVFGSFFDKVVVLVLGGFVLAVAISRHNLDEYLSQKLIGRFGNKPSMVVLGVLTVTAGISLWISNSAAAALSIPIVLLILKKNKRKPGKSYFGKAMVLAVAYGATIGGMGTLIGSTPNVLTQKFLTEQNVLFGFWEWGIRAFPFTVLMVVIAWITLIHLFRPEIRSVKIQKHVAPFTPEQKKVAGIFIFTVLLWITESIHGIPNSVVAIFPIILLSIFRLITAKDFDTIGWDTLILIGGGIALGTAIEASGLSSIFASKIGSFFATQSLWMIMLTLALVGIGMTSFISNTAASAVLIPIVTSLAGILHLDLTNLVTVAALGVSLDFIFPMGTPPTAIAYSSNYIHMRDLIISGVIISLLGAILLTLISVYTW